MTVKELHQQLTALIEQGHGDVVITVDREGDHRILENGDLCPDSLYDDNPAFRGTSFFDNTSEEAKEIPVIVITTWS
jgi:hypothetical protein